MKFIDLVKQLGKENEKKQMDELYNLNKELIDDYKESIVKLAKQGLKKIVITNSCLNMDEANILLRYFEYEKFHVSHKQDFLNFELTIGW
ncbi:hypothetical protein CON01_00710 [Bacillus thuringiensis]|uniref:Uncharacterized protein n=1 Tax=Bacillus thuringiensis TaxID=1428 RepID=A0A9X6YIM5_BACTU|nr:hypothetical protein [Bacillus thuringiensis]MDO6628805.1 hypothetical protein [Bacillus thuringiensis]MDO6659276.1 hypothetical protein [Bacillus thuringiensis]MDO6698858.1 hypothetical protein [Bacillus thuringiensis]PED16404.1 hypothetical protein CON01_00710 [Bacillus thuringiensis]PES54406.1 hypothetical protein CN506_20235 [Bacillus thuringiensis]